MALVTAPVYLIWSKTDPVSTPQVCLEKLMTTTSIRIFVFPLFDFQFERHGLLKIIKDIEWLATRLGNLKGSVEVDAPVFSHGDFFMSTQVSKLVYQPLLKMLPPPL